MKVLLDTNVLISAFVFGGVAKELLLKLFSAKASIYVSEYVDAEFLAILHRKWALQADEIYSLFHELDFIFCKSVEVELGVLRDKKDIPVLSDAIHHQIPIIVSGDKDFLEAEIDNPIIISPHDMLEFLKHNEKPL